MNIPTPEEFVRMVNPDKDYKQPDAKLRKKDDSISFGTVDSDYTTGRPSVVYDIDAATGSLSKPLMYLSSYSPAANDRVMIVKGVIIGKIL
jgi:hypothetical protein